MSNKVVGPQWISKPAYTSLETMPLFAERWRLSMPGKASGSRAWSGSVCWPTGG